MSHSDTSTPTTSQPPRERPWWVDTLLLVGCIAIGELCLNRAIELADLELTDWTRSLLDAAGLALLIGPLYAWIMYRRHVDARMSLDRFSRSGRALNSPHTRVRVAVLGSMGVIAAVLAASLWGQISTTARLARTAELVRLAGNQSALAQRIARHAPDAIDNPFVETSIRAATSNLETGAVQLDSLTAAFEVAAFAAAKNARDAIAASTPPRDALAASTVAMFAAPVRSAARRAAAVEVIRRADALMVVAEATGSALQMYSEERVRRSVRSAWMIALLMQMLIGIIALLVIEPVIRLLKQQHQIASARSVEFRRLAMVAERTSNAVMITDADRLTTWVNNGFTRLTGYSFDEAVGCSPGELLQSANTDPATVRLLNDALNKGTSARCEILNRMKDGSEYWLDLSIEPLHERGVLTGFISIESDITEQVQTRVALDAQRARAESALAALQRTTGMLEEAQTVASLGSWSHDIVTNHREWSRETFRLHGRDPNDGTPAYVDMLSDFVEADAAPLHEAVQRTATTGTPYSLLLQTSRGANGVRYVRAEGRARYDASGNVSGMFGTVMDVTAAIEREEELRLAQERAEAASQSKSEFLANMSHEIRTPLTAILGYTDLLRDEAIRHGASDEQLQSMSTIRRAGQHLLTVINDILDISKIEAGRMAIERVETDLPRVLFDVDSLMRSRAAQKGVVLQTRLLTPIPDRVLSDPTRLRQILMNLVGNAAKFTSHGQIDIQVDVSTLAGEPAVRIAVVDTGPGMSPQQATHLFQPFVQADTSVTRKHGGTGLGLTICRRLASLMGGDVQLVKTALGEGSTFTVTLPLHAVEGAQNIEDLNACIATPSALDATGAYAVALRGRILLAEDGEDNQRLISHHLRKAGAEVVIAEHGRRALELMAAADAAGRPFGLLLSDMQMPEMDGYTLARTLRAQGNGIPIIALTAHAMADDRQKCLDAGCNDYASKPIDRGILIAACARWMQSTPDDASEPRSIEIFPQPMLYSDLRDDPDFTELVDAFVAGLAAKVARIEHAFSTGELVDLARLAHQLKGAAGGYGYPSISDAARHVEQYARARVTADGTFDPGMDLSDAVALLLDQCCLAIRTLEHAS
ncbi:ATP-binding protein [Gemmatimonas sp.]|uniref:ATP-binding protein n=1 Tax=Gemmatimonas sp. TaxID=1962908 RepID=UPI003983631D